MKEIMFWLHRFVMAYGIIMLGTFFMCLLFNPTSQLPVVSFFGRCIILTLICMATLIVYYSRKDLTPGACCMPFCWRSFYCLLPTTGSSGTGGWMP